MTIHKGLSKENVVFLRRLSNVVGITIPKHLLEALGWTEGDILILSVKKKQLVAVKGKIEVA